MGDTRFPESPVPLQILATKVALKLMELCLLHYVRSIDSVNRRVIYLIQQLGAESAWQVSFPCISAV